MSLDRPSAPDRRMLNVLILGSGERARRIARTLESDRRERARVCGFLDDDPSDGDRRALGERYLGRLDRLPEIASRSAIDWVIFGLPRRFLAHDSTANAIGLCETLGIDLTIPVDLFDTRAAHVVRRDVAGLPAISFSVHGRRPVWQFGMKRALDIAGALAVLVVSAPVWIAVALAVKLDSPGPIFFVQPRCGRYGRVFPFLKFRTMVTDAEARKAELRALNEKSGPVFKMTRDPRVTRVGRILRKYSLDELPQVLNVLMGHMSLVGPRPPVPAEVEKYELDHRGRLSMRPGITCLWQVSGRNEIEFEDWVKLDIEYVERWSLLLDLQILLATFPAVISGRGAS
ncbi:MAG TPA: sugar transferase [Myxococcota bacterium]|nr:sugar transferase [Myxococcota bacterium]